MATSPGSSTPSGMGFGCPPTRHCLAASAHLRQHRVAAPRHWERQESPRDPARRAASRRYSRPTPTVHTPTRNSRPGNNSQATKPNLSVTEARNPTLNTASLSASSSSQPPHLHPYCLDPSLIVSRSRGVDSANPIRPRDSSPLPNLLPSKSRWPSFCSRPGLQVRFCDCVAPLPNSRIRTRGWGLGTG